MKNNKKKRGFTIIELVIVIAVIAILAGVLIPTFSSVIEKANRTARLENARNALTAVLGEDYDIKEAYIQVDASHYYHYENGQLSTDEIDTTKTGVAAPDVTTFITIYHNATTDPTTPTNGSVTKLTDIPAGVIVYTK